MNKSKELKNTTQLVKQILIENELARKSDDYLYYKVCKMINPQAVNVPFKNAIVHRKYYGFPAFESVRRTRQKIQAAYPELCACEDVEMQRTLNEEVFRGYAKAVKV